MSARPRIPDTPTTKVLFIRLTAAELARIRKWCGRLPAATGARLAILAALERPIAELTKPKPKE